MTKRKNKRTTISSKRLLYLLSIKSLCLDFFPLFSITSVLHKTDSLKLSTTIRDRLLRPAHSVIIIIIMIMISIFNEDNVFSTTANLPYGPLMNTDNDYYRTFSLRLFPRLPLDQE